MAIHAAGGEHHQRAIVLSLAAQGALGAGVGAGPHAGGHLRRFLACPLVHPFERALDMDHHLLKPLNSAGRFEPVKRQPRDAGLGQCHIPVLAKLHRLARVASGGEHQRGGVNGARQTLQLLDHQIDERHRPILAAPGVVEGDGALGQVDVAVTQLEQLPAARTAGEREHDE
jgi:hypothetical protein